MSRAPIPTWFFVLTVVRDDDRFLLIKERRHGQGWYLPAGRVEPGETLVEAAIRETLEESGVHAEITGLLKVQHSPRGSGARVRVVFVGKATSGEPGPTADSLDARWVTLADLDDLELRAGEVRTWLELAITGPTAPLTLLGTEAPGQ